MPVTFTGMPVSASTVRVMPRSADQRIDKVGSSIVVM